MKRPKPEPPRTIDRESLAGSPSRIGPSSSDATGTTVGIGSVLGIGCVIALVVFVLVAIAARWMTGG